MFRVSVHRNLLLERMRMQEAEEDKKKSDKEAREKAFRDKHKKKDSDEAPEKKKEEPKSEPKKDPPSEKKPEKKSDSPSKPAPKKSGPPEMPKFDPPKFGKEPEKAKLPDMPSLDMPKDEPSAPKQSPKLKAEPSGDMPKHWGEPGTSLPSLSALAAGEKGEEPWHKKMGLPDIEPRKGNQDPFGGSPDWKTPSGAKPPPLPKKFKNMPDVPSLASLAGQEKGNEPWHKKAGLPDIEPQAQGDDFGAPGWEMPKSKEKGAEKPGKPKAGKPKMKVEPSVEPGEDMPQHWSADEPDAKDSGMPKSVQTPTLSSLVGRHYGKDILPKDPKWKVGDTVNIGFMNGLKVTGKTGNRWHLQRGGRKYDFIPHRGIYKVG